MEHRALLHNPATKARVRINFLESSKTASGPTEYTSKPQNSPNRNIPGRSNALLIITANRPSAKEATTKLMNPTRQAIPKTAFLLKTNSF